MGLVSYQLLIEVQAPLRLQIGRLGAFDFPAGSYCYTGSARSNLEARLARHLAKEKALRWHIDYLLTAPGVHVRDVRRYTEAECELNQQVLGQVLVRGFGASDCRAGCGSHLKWLGPLKEILE